MQQMPRKLLKRNVKIRHIRLLIRDLRRKLKDLKEERMSEFESRILDMLDKVRTLKRVIDEIEEPLEEFNEHLFREIAVDMEINNRDEMTVTLLGGLKFTELI